MKWFLRIKLSFQPQASPGWKIALIGLLVAATLACGTNARVARQPTARPTRTPLPTFTHTPIPTPAPLLPTATPTLEPPTPTETPIPTDTPLPTDIPLPTDTLAPPPPPPPPLPPPPPPPPPEPPTDTPEPPTSTPEPVAISPVDTPTNTPVPGSPPGEYEARDVERESNCAHVGVRGKVTDNDDDEGDPIASVTIQVTGDEDGFRGPYMATTGSNGEYGLVIGEFGKVPDQVEFRAEIYGPDTKTEERPIWSVLNDCHASDANQVMKIDWIKK